MNIIRAEHMGMCFGVRDAIALAKQAANNQSITILGELVHNETVLNDLRQRGVQIEHSIESVTTPTVMITAHGASERRLEEVRRHGLHVLEATCPLVTYAHNALRKLVRAGFHPVVIGKRDHVEVRGLTEDFTEFDVVLSVEDIARVAERPRFGVVSQTTQPTERVRALVDAIRQRFPNSEVRFVDTVCQPTKQRQLAAVELAKKCTAVVVIGGAQSNNTRELVNTCSRHCSRVYHVQGAGDVRPEWFHATDTIGITAGTSTPDSLIGEVESAIARLHPIEAIVNIP